eukprot:jgi/Chrzof1/12916/Cz07g12070.t1
MLAPPSCSSCGAEGHTATECPEEMQTHLVAERLGDIKQMQKDRRQVRAEQFKPGKQRQQQGAQEHNRQSPITDYTSYRHQQQQQPQQAYDRPPMYQSWHHSPKHKYSKQSEHQRPGSSGGGSSTGRPTQRQHHNSNGKWRAYDSEPAGKQQQQQQRQKSLYDGMRDNFSYGDRHPHKRPRR